MRRKLLVVAAIGSVLAACDSSGDGDETGVTPPGPADVPAGSEDGLRARVEAAMAHVLLDPASARYAGLRSGADGAICGQVIEGRQAARLFLVTSDGIPVLSSPPGPAAANDPFLQLYLRYCAAPGDSPQPDPGTDVPAADEIPIPPPPIPVPADDPLAEDPPPARPAPSRPRPAGQDDSFFNSVLRPDAPPRPRQ